MARKKNRHKNLKNCVFIKSTIPMYILSYAVILTLDTNRQFNFYIKKNIFYYIRVASFAQIKKG